jgi:hypothetical protein
MDVEKLVTLLKYHKEIYNLAGKNNHIINFSINLMNCYVVKCEYCHLKYDSDVGIICATVNLGESKQLLEKKK